MRKKEKKVKSLSHVRLFATLWTVACQAPPSMEFSRQEYWSGLAFPSPGDLPNPGFEPGSPAVQADACVDHNKLWKILKELGILEHLTCLLRNLYGSEEPTARILHEQLTDSKLGKEYKSISR